MRFNFERFAFSVVAAVAMLAGCGGTADIGAPATDGSARMLSDSRTFYYTGAKQSFKVPAGVTKITIVGIGGKGGVERGEAPGYAGRTTAVIPVTPGDRLFVYVGGDASGENGGFNGGASGGGGPYNDYGYGGGGASDVRRGGDRLADRIFVVGGGGGEGGFGYNGYVGGKGGEGGGATGGSGLAGSPSSGFSSGQGGGGGTQHHGGSGGRGAGRDGSYENSGSDGQVGAGGSGGSGCSLSSYCLPGGGGGGGGAGYYGGGGGGTGGDESYWFDSGGGGGGGSSYVERSATSVRTWQGWKRTVPNGLIVIDW
jgi:hypothetical protein